MVYIDTNRQTNRYIFVFINFFKIRFVTIQTESNRLMPVQASHVSQLKN